MSKTKNIFYKIKYRLRHSFFSIQNIILVVAVGFCLIWTYQSISSISRNWQLSERLTIEKKELELLKIEVATAELENEYYSTSEYQELAARRLLKKQLPGEHLVILPENSESAKQKHSAKTVAIQSKNYSNFEKWLLFLFQYQP